MTIKVTGIEDVDELLGRIAPRHAKNILRSTLNDVAKQLATDAISKAPVSAGAPTKGGAHFASKKVIKYKRDRQRYNSTVLSSSVIVTGVWSPLWHLLERGTNDTPEFGMFLKSVEAIAPKLDGIMRESFQKKLAAAVKREQKKAG